MVHPRGVIPLMDFAHLSDVGNSFSHLDTTISSVGSPVYAPDGNVISSQGDLLVLCLLVNPLNEL